MHHASCCSSPQMLPAQPRSCKPMRCSARSSTSARWGRMQAASCGRCCTTKALPPPTSSRSVQRLCCPMGRDALLLAGAFNLVQCRAVAHCKLPAHRTHTPCPCPALRPTGGPGRGQGAGAHQRRGRPRPGPGVLGPIHPHPGLGRRRSGAGRPRERRHRQAVAGGLGVRVCLDAQQPYCSSALL